MFWTNWVRGLTKVFLGVGVLASLIVSILIGGELGFFGFLACMVVCLVVLISSVALIMMLSEISVSAHEINKKLNGSSNSDLSNSSLSNSMASLDEAPKTNPSYVNREETDRKYCIKCGASLRVNDKTCFKCGARQLDELF